MTTAGILSDLLRGLPVVSREGDPRVLGPAAKVWPEERQAVERAVAKRQNEYFATRHLARLALAELAVPDCAILNNDDRSPRWPDGIVGSLTHTDSWCGVAVAKFGAPLRNVGIDLERVGSVSPEVAKRILSERELSGATPREASLRFSAKEAFYKAIYPFVRRYVGFGEVEIELGSARAFEVRVVSSQLASEVAERVFKGHYALNDELCATVVVVE